MFVLPQINKPKSDGRDLFLDEANGFFFFSNISTGNFNLFYDFQIVHKQGASQRFMECDIKL